MKRTTLLYPITRTGLSTSLLEEFDRVFDSFFKDSAVKPTSTTKQSPKLNAYQKGNKFCIDFAIPMASKEDIHVEINENILKVSVDAHQDKEVKDDDYIIREITRSQMVRTISLGEELAIDSAKSTFKDGVLHIEFDSKQIEVTPDVKKLTIE